MCERERERECVCVCIISGYLKLSALKPRQGSINVRNQSLWDLPVPYELSVNLSKISDFSTFQY